ncbi:hypothetical protein [Demequina flava]|uniref:hypothetical protein n=1 Tax=Demequina flava TaxID=1095025 RepID=UPI0007851B81|nr:hypothetical protein [Demequina flava]
MAKSNGNGLLITGTILGAVLIGALAYVFVISPQLDSASSAREDTEFARDENDLLEIQIAQMQALEQEVPGWREEIAKISLDLPPRVEQSEFERLIAGELEEVELPLVDVTYGRATVIDPLALGEFEPPALVDDEETDGEASPETSAEPSPEPTTTAGDDAATEGEAEQPAQPVAEEPPFEGLYGIPVTLTTEGDPAAVLDFVKSMNSQLERYFTVTNLTVSTATVSEETPERPELSEEDWTVQISGLVFSLIDIERSFPGDEEGQLPEYTVGGDPDNAFAPLDGLEEDEAA